MVDGREGIEVEVVVDVAGETYTYVTKCIKLKTQFQSINNVSLHFSGAHVLYVLKSEHNLTQYFKSYSFSLYIREHDPGAAAALDIVTVTAENLICYT